jgi:nucleotide-binding universal stress UspA family protein
LIAVGVVVYQLRRPVERAVEVAAKTMEAAQREILVPVANPMTAESLTRIAAILGKAREEATLALLSIAQVPTTTPLELAQDMLDQQDDGRKAVLKRAAAYAHQQDVPVRTLLRAARRASDGILSVAESRAGVGMILMGWRGQLSTQRVVGSVVKDVVHSAPCDVAVLRDRGIGEKKIERVLVPVGGGPHARLALQLAWDIARAEGGTITALRILPAEGQVDLAVEMDVLSQVIEDVLGGVPEEVTLRLARSDSIAEGILAEAGPGEEQAGHDLIAIGASEEWFLKNLLFGSIPDRVADGAGCSVLMVRKYEPAPVSWARRAIKGQNRRNKT